MLREYLYKYYVERVSWSRSSPSMKNDGARHWYVAKAVKDYIILLGQNQFSESEIKELIESEAILNFANDMIK